MAQGARAGLAKALGREWPETHARVVDVDPMLPDAAAARLALDEPALDDGLVEVFVDNAQRSGVTLEVESPPAPGGALPEGAVVALTGGTRGVTALVALELARRGPVKLALLARTPPGEAPLDEPAEKARIKAELAAAGERATPVKVEGRLKPLRRAEEARQNVAAMRDLGAEVAFYKVDMADPDAVAAVMDQVRADLGFIAGVVHGAGLEESRLIADKTEADFARVFDGKARGHRAGPEPGAGGLVRQHGLGRGPLRQRGAGRLLGGQRGHGPGLPVPSALPARGLDGLGRRGHGRPRRHGAAAERPRRRDAVFAGGRVPARGPRLWRHGR